MTGAEPIEVEGAPASARQVVNINWFIDCTACGVSLLAVDQAGAEAVAAQHNRGEHGPWKPEPKVPREPVPFHDPNSAWRLDGDTD